jgi:exonuclease III
MTCANDVRTRKIVSIIDLDKDFILLSDIRLINQSNMNFLLDKFRFRYRIVAHSTKARRGVAILIKNSVDFNLLRELRDENENILILHCKISGHVIGSIYGPNCDDTDFFTTLDNILDSITCG